MMKKYRVKTNTVLRNTIQAALGIPYLRKEDLDHVCRDLNSLFDHIETSDPEKYNFLCNFVDNFIGG